MNPLNDNETVLAIDPGNFESAFCFLRGDRKIVDFGKHANEWMLRYFLNMVKEAPRPSRVVCEMVASYGMAVGASVFDTCIFIGRLQEIAVRSGQWWEQVTRLEVKLHVCKSPAANDSNIRTALIDLYGAPGTKKSPGPTYGISKDVWAALALAETVRSGNYRAYVPVHERTAV
jgi:hypothetical protein